MNSTVNGIPIERKFVATNMAASDHQCVASPQPSATAGQSAATPDPPVATPTPNAIDTAGPTIEAANDPNQHNDHSLPPLTAALIPTSAPIATPTPVAVLVATPVLTRPVARAVPAVASVDRKMVTRSKLGVSLRRPNKDLPQTIASAATQPPKRVALNQSMKFCLDIIRELLTKKHRDYAWPFYDPVPTQQYPDYLDIVKKPIDLNTIKTKIETGQYKTVKPFVKDMRLMFTNCLRYNKPDAPVIEQARKLRDFFEYRYARIPEELLKEKLITNNHQNGHQNNSHSNGHNNNTHNNRHKEKETNGETDGESIDRMRLLETQVRLLSTTISALTGIDTNKLKPKNGVKKSATNGNSRRKRPTPKSNGHRNGNANHHKKQKTEYLNGNDIDDEEYDEEEEDEPLAPSPIAFDANDLDDLQQLKTDLENLDAKDLKNVLRILQSTEPSIKCDNDENIEIDFEALKPETLMALRKFVSSCMLNSKPKKSRASLNGSESSKTRTNCDMKNGYNVSSTAGADPSNDAMNLSDSESESSSSSDSEED